MRTTRFTNVWVKSKAYKKLMRLMGECLKSGGWVDFVQDGDHVSCTMNWEA